jgi:hypothetical protein
MSRIQFIAVRIVSDTEADILTRLRAVADRSYRRDPEDAPKEPPVWKLREQARGILERRRQHSGIAHLRREEATRLAVLKHGA